MSFIGNTFNSSGTVPAVQIALDLINDHPTLLPNYKLHYQLTDSQVSVVSTLYKFCFHVVYIVYAQSLVLVLGVDYCTFEVDLSSLI